MKQTCHMHAETWKYKVSFYMKKYEMFEVSMLFLNKNWYEDVMVKKFLLKK